MKTLSFEGNGWEYFKIWIVNVLLTVITLGIYYPWAKVRNLRYFYANSSLEGKKFNFHATGKQLFIGYLIAMVLLVIFVLVQKMSPTGNLFLLSALFLASPWIIWRSLKFNLIMTSFSNVRFSFSGDLSNAYINFLLLPIALAFVVYGTPAGLAFVIYKTGISFNTLTIVLGTLALLVFIVLAIYGSSFLKKRNTCYTINGFRFGQGVFGTTVETRGFAIISLRTMSLGFLVIIAFILTLPFAVSMTRDMSGVEVMQLAMSDPQKTAMLISDGLRLLIVPVYTGMIAASLFIMAYSYTRQRAYIYSNSRLDDEVAFVSTLRARSMAWVMISNLIIIIFSLGFAIPWAKVRMARLILKNTQIAASSGFDKYVTEIKNKESALGEQIGDAFDVQVEIGI
ncbi:MAG: uncharacterized membrane protein YjgN (DUF898 family) [Motiliproteus sp.]|jgi:uncharacterized membrane protein YjgN (DUF898 family)